MAVFENVIPMSATRYFGERLRDLRKTRRISAVKLADFLKCSPSLIYNIEKGLNRPQSDIILRIADYFSVSTDYLLGGLPETDERELIKLYRTLDSEGKQVIYNLLILLKKIS
jgi:transcriptional regulator with XRE-family HTH domain